MTLLKLISKSRMNSIYFQIIGKKKKTTTTTACGKAVELEPLSSQLTFIYVLHYGFSSQKVGPAGAGRRPLSEQLGSILAVGHSINFAQNDQLTIRIAICELHCP